MITWIRNLLAAPRALVHQQLLLAELSVQLHGLQRLMQEQIALTRELVTAQTHKSPTTPPSILTSAMLQPTIASLEATWRSTKRSAPQPMSFSTRHVYTGSPATASDVSTPESRAARDQMAALQAEKQKNL